MRRIVCVSPRNGYACQGCSSSPPPASLSTTMALYLLMCHALALSGGALRTAVRPQRASRAVAPRAAADEPAARLPDEFLSAEEFAQRGAAHRNVMQLRLDAPRALSAPPDASIFAEGVCLRGDLGQTLVRGRERAGVPQRFVRRRLLVARADL